MAALLGVLVFSLCVAGCGSGSKPAKAQVLPRLAPAGPRSGLGGDAGPPVAGAHRAPRERVPVLIYHVVESAPAGAPSPGLWVPRSEFKAEVDGLAARGYHAVTLRQLWDAWHGQGLLPSKPIVFSFDDGYASQYTNALPILRSHGWNGVLNLEVAKLHTTLRPGQVGAMIRAGWEIDAHTMTHPDLTKVYGQQLRYQVSGSRRWIRRRFGVPADFFCYPAGRFDAHVVAAVTAAGYLAATTTNLGLAGPSQPRYELPRIRVTPGDGIAGIERNLQAATSRQTTDSRTRE